STGGGTGGSGAGTGGTGGGGTPSTTPQAYKTCDATNRVGGFVVDLKRNPDSTPFTAISGGVRSGVDPTLIWQELAKDGDCRVMVGPKCSPPCPAGKACGGTNMCLDEPLTQDTGTLTVTGLPKSEALPFIPSFG